VKPYISILFAVSFIAAVAVTPAFAQQKPADADKTTEGAARQAEAVARAAQKVAEEAAAENQAQAAVIIPIDVEVVISRYQGEKKISSLPYTLSVNAGSNRQPTRLRMGGAVPMPTMAPITGPDGKPVGPVGGGPVQYMDVGTNIDSNARILPDGRFDVFVSIEDKSVATSGQVAPASTMPFVRTFVTSNYLVLRDGQTRQFTAAADRVTGEVVKVDVTLRVVK